GRDDLVFTALRGAPLRHNLFYRKKFKPAVARAGLPQSLRFHDYADLRVMPIRRRTSWSPGLSGWRASA
ncbi:MAG: hypothetical protein ACRD0U_12545, partial [Acidimicrobiales bacterium]